MEKIGGKPSEGTLVKKYTYWIDRTSFRSFSNSDQRRVTVHGHIFVALPSLPDHSDFILLADWWYFFAPEFAPFIVIVWRDNAKASDFLRGMRGDICVCK